MFKLKLITISIFAFSSVSCQTIELDRKAFRQALNQVYQNQQAEHRRIDRINANTRLRSLKPQSVPQYQPAPNRLSYPAPTTNHWPEYVD